jgi:hypothetical protein
MTHSVRALQRLSYHNYPPRYLRRCRECRDGAGACCLASETPVVKDVHSPPYSPRGCFVCVRISFIGRYHKLVTEAFLQTSGVLHRPSSPVSHITPVFSCRTRGMVACTSLGLACEGWHLGFRHYISCAHHPLCVIAVLTMLQSLSSRSRPRVLPHLGRGPLSWSRSSSAYFRVYCIVDDAWSLLLAAGSIRSLHSSPAASYSTCTRSSSPARLRSVPVLPRSHHHASRRACRSRAHSETTKTTMEAVCAIMPILASRSRRSFSGRGLEVA